ncbi:MAG TPA: saccharopine dehydrogenase NADP-binding domain-containing protein [Nevskiales bacterium]|nr:saccharopine dehydrogenase NADP-binding domain-containing protein [Nevskiales bacterium]
MPKNTNPSYDIVLYGATGFTGGLTAEYLARHPDLVPERFALAGRSREKLEAVKRRLVALNPACEKIGLIEADSSDPASLERLAWQTRVVITTVGPYIRYGEPLLRACAEAGTDYVDLTGEPEFVERMQHAYGETAVRSGARIVNCCGFDSIPHDLGALFTVQQLPKDGPVTVEGFVRARGNFSGGTFHSAVTAMARMREFQRWRKSVRGSRTERRGARRLRSRIQYRKELGSWVCPMPTIDPQVVMRSARELPKQYGTDFAYAHYMQVKRLSTLAMIVGGTGALFAAAQVKPLRERVLKLRNPGEGPSAEERAKGWFRVRFLGTAGGRRVVTEVRGGDPGYGDTAKMLAESALCLARDPLPQRSGFLTPAVAMGDALIARLQRHAGITFEVIQKS